MAKAAAAKKPAPADTKPVVADTPDASPVTAPAPAPASAEHVTFVTRRPGLRVMIRPGHTVTFDGDELTVDPATAEILKSHFLYLQGHILLKSDTAVEAGELIELTAEAKAARDAKADGKFVFSFTENPSGQIMLIPGKLVIEFAHGYATVDEKVAEMLRNHTFFVQGRLREI